MAAGSVRQLDSGRWQLRVSAGTDECGRRKVVTKSVDTRAEAEAHLADVVIDLEQRRRQREAKRMGPAPLPTLPIAPLESFLRRWLWAHESRWTTSVGLPTALATLAEVSVQTAHRWLRAGEIHVWAADHVAVALGVHPANVWPTWYSTVDDGPLDAA